jgi:hypothetical protein
MSEYVDELNAKALAQAINTLRADYELRLTSAENNIEVLKDLVQKQSQVLGQTLQATWGSGSTVPDPNPDDKR